MLFRQFVEQMKDSAEALARGAHGGRDVTPFFYMDTPDVGVEGVPIDPAFFAASRALTLYIVGIVRTRKPEHVAWVFTGEGDTTGHRVPLLVVIALDRERDELWHARLYRRDDGQPMLGGWEAIENAGMGFLVTPVQEALR